MFIILWHQKASLKRSIDCLNNSRVEDTTQVSAFLITRQRVTPIRMAERSKPTVSSCEKKSYGSFRKKKKLEKKKLSSFCSQMSTEKKEGEVGLATARGYRGRTEEGHTKQLKSIFENEEEEQEVAVAEVVAVQKEEANDDNRDDNEEQDDKEEEEKEENGDEGEDEAQEQNENEDEDDVQKDDNSSSTSSARKVGDSITEEEEIHSLARPMRKEKDCAPKLTSSGGSVMMVANAGSPQNSPKSRRIGRRTFSSGLVKGTKRMSAKLGRATGMSSSSSAAAPGSPKSAKVRDDLATAAATKQRERWLRRNDVRRRASSYTAMSPIADQLDDVLLASSGASPPKSPSAKSPSSSRSGSSSPRSGRTLLGGAKGGGANKSSSALSIGLASSPPGSPKAGATDDSCDSDAVDNDGDNENGSDSSAERILYAEEIGGVLGAAGYEVEESVDEGDEVGAPEIVIQRWYRDHFEQCDHFSWIARATPLGPAVLSYKKEHGSLGASHYRIIVRTKDGDQRVLLPASSVEPSGYRTSPTKLLRVANPALAMSRFQKVPTPDIVGRLIVLEAQQTPRNFKFGVLYAAPGQRSEGQWFSNGKGSPAFDRFLTSVLGERIALSGHTGFRAGLDVTGSDATGAESVFTEFRDHEIMFHVSTLLPHTPADPQQIAKKRFIGNDVVLIVFKESEDDQYDCTAISSDMIHVVIIVQPVFAKKTKKQPPSSSSADEPQQQASSSSGAAAAASTNGADDMIGFRVRTIYKDGVSPFFPCLPRNHVFRDPSNLRPYLLCKAINGEIAAYTGFSQLATTLARVRETQLDDLVGEFLTDRSTKKSKKLGFF
jgi:Rap/ran-GAP/Rap/Ran-GAP protein dimerization domain